MLANLPLPAGHDANTPCARRSPGGADAAAHPRLSSGANRGIASQQAAALARPPEQSDAPGEERASRSRGPGFSVGRRPGAPGGVLLLGKGAVLAHRLARPLAAE